MPQARNAVVGTYFIRSTKIWVNEKSMLSGSSTVRWRRDVAALEGSRCERCMALPWWCQITQCFVDVRELRSGSRLAYFNCMTRFLI